MATLAIRLAAPDRGLAGFPKRRLALSPRTIQASKPDDQLIEPDLAEHSNPVFLNLVQLAPGNPVPFHIEVKERGKPFLSFIIGFGRGNQGTDISDVVVLEKQVIQISEIFQRIEIEDLVPIKGQRGKPLQGTDSLNALNLIHTEMERRKLWQIKNRIDILNPIVAQVESRHVGQRGERLQVTDLIVR